MQSPLVGAGSGCTPRRPGSARAPAPGADAASPPEQADHPLCHAAPAPARRRAWRRHPPSATGQPPLRRCIGDPCADGRRPRHDRRRRQILPDRRIHVRHLTAAPVPAHRCLLADARHVPTAHGIPRSIPRRGRTLDERRPRFRMTCPPRHGQRARHPRGRMLQGAPHARASMPRSGRQAPRDGIDRLRPDGVPPPGAPHPLIRQRHDLLVGRPRAAGLAPHPLPVWFPRARLVRRIPPVPPACLKGGGFAGRLSTVSVPPNARADPSVS
jgi:hypothetical protein